VTRTVLTRGALGKTVLLMAVGAGAQQGACQNLYYVEAGVASCPAAPAAGSAAPKAVPRGVALQGSVSVACGFDQGSYTVTLDSTDPSASFAPKSFLVNFGRVVGKGVFAVTFSTLGVHRVSATITSNMGSPAVRGYFASHADAFKVVPR